MEGARQQEQERKREVLLMQRDHEASMPLMDRVRSYKYLLTIHTKPWGALSIVFSAPYDKFESELESESLHGKGGGGSTGQKGTLVATEGGL